MPRPDPLHTALDAQLRVLGDDLRHRCARAFARHLRGRRRAALAAHDGPVTLTLEDLAALVRRSGLRCERSTVPFSLDRIGGVRLLAPSLDRIDPEGDYTLANLRLVCWYVNRARGPWSEALQQLISQGIAARHGARLSRAQTEAMRAFVQGLGPWKHAWSGAAANPVPPVQDGAPVLAHRDPPYAGSAGDGAWRPAVPSGGPERLLTDAVRRLTASLQPGAVLAVASGGGVALWRGPAPGRRLRQDGAMAAPDHGGGATPIRFAQPASMASAGLCARPAAAMGVPLTGCPNALLWPGENPATGSGGWWFVPAPTALRHAGPAMPGCGTMPAPHVVP
jgi:hypothetical protein